MKNLVSADFDVAVLGGGPLACAIARDASGRGLRVVLIAAGDLGVDVGQHIVASGQALLTQNAPTRHDDVPVMNRISPHLMRDADFAKPVNRLARLFSPLAPASDMAFCTHIPLRFAILNARDAAQRGTTIHLFYTVTSQTWNDTHWTLTLDTGPDVSVSAALVVDTRPGTSAQLARVALYDTPADVQTTLEHQGTRTQFTVNLCDGTTAVGLIDDTGPSVQDFAVPARAASITADPIWVSDAFSPHTGNPDLEIQTSPPKFIARDTLPAGWRVAAEEIVAEMAPFVTMIGKKWTAIATLPGGDFQPTIRSTLIAEFAQSHPQTDPQTLQRLFATYGTQSIDILNKSAGLDFGFGLFESEVRWLHANEWAASADSILWQRTRLGMVFSPGQTATLQNWLDSNRLNSDSCP